VDGKKHIIICTLPNIITQGGQIEENVIGGI
jgi:hypothetical protein